MNTTSLAALNAMDPDSFTQMLGAVFEAAPWVARAAQEKRPFASADALYRAMWDVVEAAERTTKLELLRGYPELGAGNKSGLHPISKAEQSGLGLDELPPDESARFATANTAYRNRFGFPFIIALRSLQNRDEVLTALKTRFYHSVDVEMRTALMEAGRIARYRLQDMISQGGVTTQVLDLTTGKPAVGMHVELQRLDGAKPGPLFDGVTGENGRCPSALLEGADMAPGHYEIMFRVADWRAQQQQDRGFFTDIPIRFHITDHAAFTHIPLFLSPFGYSTHKDG